MSIVSRWWVNHNSSSRKELNDGYIMSPQKESDGKKNQTYLNLKKAKPGDTVYSFADSVIGAVGVIASTYEDCLAPKESKEITYSVPGWKVEVEWIQLAKPLSPRSKIQLIAPLLPKKYMPLLQNGKGNQKCYLAAISEDLDAVLRGLLIQEGNVEVNSLLNELSAEVIRDYTRASSQIELPNGTYVNPSEDDVDDTEASQLIKARKGQGKFRSRVIEVEGRCRVTGLDAPELLIASHIKPWSVSTNAERLDGNNGLLLSPHVDKLFDKGLVTFESDGRLVVVESYIPVLLNWHIDPEMNVGAFNASQEDYLKYHHKHIYKG